MHGLPTIVNCRQGEISRRSDSVRHHQCTINAASMQHQCTINAPSMHHQCTINAPSMEVPDSVFDSSLVSIYLVKRDA